MRKQTISKALKISVWNKYIGEDIGKYKCLCCNITDITQLKFHVGHIIAEANGGTLHIDNLKPICECCNKSMRTKNMDEFKKQLTSINYAKNDSLKENILNVYNNIVKLVNDKYNLIIKKEGLQVLTNKMLLTINNISGNKYSDINVLFFEKCRKDGINNKKLNLEDFDKLKNNNSKLYDYLAQIDEKTLLDLMYLYYDNN
jgi:hypothetical protein